MQKTDTTPNKTYTGADFCNFPTRQPHVVQQLIDKALALGEMPQYREQDWVSMKVELTNVA
ncbi:hypothetical protein VP1G_11283 [Cytospora mali]|uniref:Uncharacterized protein n=1 Tax=Cytospora mali TaxID=578113 RepID=A0A194VDH5_CYTMA|nr:hypothetical protein VP1G_11283 [Valsa mali var. pyri (nom. inval.)]